MGTKCITIVCFTRELHLNCALFYCTLITSDFSCLLSIFFLLRLLFLFLYDLIDYALIPFENDENIKTHTHNVSHGVVVNDSGEMVRSIKMV